MVKFIAETNIVNKITLLNFKLSILEKCSKNTFLSLAKINKVKLQQMHQTIIEQIYILNKLYNKLITSAKLQLDENIENYCKSTTLKKEKYYQIIINNEYKNLNSNILKFLHLQETVKNNVINYLNNVKNYENFYQNNFEHIKSNNKLIEELEPSSPTLTLSMPNVNYCKQDLDKTIQYINNLHKENINYEKN